MARVTNPLPQLVKDRIDRTLAILREQSPWILRSEALAVEGAPVHSLLAPHPDASAAPRLKYAAVAPGSVFGPAKGDWHQRWMRVRIPAPRAGEKGRRHIEWRCQGEATAFLDGEPWAGLDSAHPVMPLPDRACTLHIDNGLYPTGGIWGPHYRPIDEFGARFDACRLLVRDDRLWQLQFDLEIVDRLIQHRLEERQLAPPWVGYHPAQEKLDPLTRQLIRAADEVCDAFAADGVTGLAKGLAGFFRSFPAERWQPTAALVGHSHLDLVWLWPEAVTERKGVHTAASMLRLLERNPEFRFVQSQPALYRAIARLAPGQAAAIGKRLQEGRWEATGGFEVEPDNHLPCGEALARSLVLGQAHFASLRGGEPSRVCWLPDVFGYSACLPQILALGGITGFYTTKMTWSAVTKFPYTSFVWRGADGSEVLAHLCSTGYNGNATVGELVNSLAEHRQADVHPEMLLPTGFGDGGGGTTEEQIARARRMADLAGVPKARWSGVEDVFARMDRQRARLPVYQGELYFEYHRGTYTTQAGFKRRYRALERALQQHEAVRVALHGSTSPQAGKPLDQEDWRRLAFAQFHDAIPGSSIGLVYEQLGAELERRAAAQSAEAACELSATGHNTGFLAFNPLPLSRRSVVELPGRIAAVQTPDGLPLPVQHQGDRTLTVCDLAALGSERLLPQPRATASGRIPAIAEVGVGVLDNGFVRARFDRAGQLMALSVDGESLDFSGACGLALYRDVPANFDAWDIDHDALARPLATAPAMRLEVVERGPVRAVLRGEAALGKASRVQVRYVMEAGCPWLRIELDLDWQEDRRLLKWHAPTGYRGRCARFGTPFGSVARPQLPGTPADEAQWEVPASRWAAVGDDDGRGLAIVTEASYGFSCKDGDLGLSLLRAPKDPDPHADRGRHGIRFAIGRHREAATHDRACTAAAADLLFTPPLVVAGGELTPPPFAFEHLGSLVPAWVLPDPGGGYVVRLHEVAGGRGEAVMGLAGSSSTLEYVDLLGRRLSDARPRKADARTWRLPYQPYQILSVRVR